MLEQVMSEMLSTEGRDRADESPDIKDEMPLRPDVCALELRPEEERQREDAAAGRCLTPASALARWLPSDPPHPSRAFRMSPDQAPYQASFPPSGFRASALRRFEPVWQRCPKRVKPRKVGCSFDSGITRLLHEHSHQGM